MEEARPMAIPPAPAPSLSERVAFLESRLADLVERVTRERAEAREDIAAFQRATADHLRDIDAFRRTVSEHLAALTGGLTAFERTTVAHLESTDAFRRTASEHLAALTGGLTAFERTASAHLESLGAFQRVAAAHFGESDDFRRTASDHLAALTEKLIATERQVRTLDHALHAPPYMASPARFRVADIHGNAVIGYRDADANADADADDLYRGFEEAFRGPESLIRERQRRYLPLLAGRTPVLDLGCGRGEFLDLLAGAGVAATGVDSDEGMVAHCRAKGHTVAHEDAVRYLARAEPVGAVFAAQVVEHLPYPTLLALLRGVRGALQPGGVFVAETVNPHAVSAFRTFWTDLTHRAPIFPEVLAVLCRLAGFHTAAILFPNGTGDPEADRRTQGEYAVVATVAGGRGEMTNPLLPPVAPTDAAGAGASGER